MSGYIVSKTQSVDGCINLNESNRIDYDTKTTTLNGIIPKLIKSNRWTEEIRVALNKIYSEVSFPILKNVKFPLKEKDLIKLIKSNSQTGNDLIFLESKDEYDKNYLVIKIHKDKLPNNDFIFFTKIDIQCSEDLE